MNSHPGAQIARSSAPAAFIALHRASSGKSSSYSVLWYVNCGVERRRAREGIYKKLVALAAASSSRSPSLELKSANIIYSKITTSSCIESRRRNNIIRRRGKQHEAGAENNVALWLAQIVAASPIMSSSAKEASAGKRVKAACKVIIGAAKSATNVS